MRCSRKYPIIKRIMLSDCINKRENRIIQCKCAFTAKHVVFISTAVNHTKGRGVSWLRRRGSAHKRTKQTMLSSIPATFFTLVVLVVDIGCMFQQICDKYYTHIFAWNRKIITLNIGGKRKSGRSENKSQHYTLAYTWKYLSELLMTWCSLRMNVLLRHAWRVQRKKRDTMVTQWRRFAIETLIFSSNLASCIRWCVCADFLPATFIEFLLLTSLNSLTSCLLFSFSMKDTHTHRNCNITMRRRCVFQTACERELPPNDRRFHTMNEKNSAYELPYTYH